MNDLNERIEALCEAKGLRFKPWEFPRPWELGEYETCDHPPGTAGANWWPKAQAMRRKLIGELGAEGAA